MPHINSTAQKNKVSFRVSFYSNSISKCRNCFDVYICIYILTFVCIHTYICLEGLVLIKKMGNVT